MQNGIYSPADIQAHFGRDPESVFSQIQSDLKTAQSFGIEMDLLHLGRKATPTPEVERVTHD